MIGSVFESESQLLGALLLLHNNNRPIELDPMYSKGNIYKNLSQPALRFDINPTQNVNCEWGDARNLMPKVKPSSINSMLLDPPFCFGVHGKTKENISAKRFTILKDWAALRDLYKAILNEAWSVLKIGGILIFKCQDYTDSKTTMTHCNVWEWATKVGFYAKDLAIYINKNRIYNPRLKQRHLRKTHSYFWVFVKK